jgi:uncharacterized protein involved in cysteine biosynthesis
MIFKEFFSGVAYCFSSMGYLSRYRLTWFFVVPFIIWLILMVLMLWSGVELAVWLYESIKNFALHYEVGKNIFSSGGFLIKLLIKIFVWYIFWMYSRYLALAIMGPFLSWISEKVEEKYLSENNLTSARVKINFICSITRGLIVSLKYAFLETLFLVLLSLASMILPFMGLITFVLMLWVSWYFSGASVMDFVLERHITDVKQTEYFIKKNRYLIMGVGMFYWACFSVPIISLFTGLVFGTVMSVTGSTVAFHKLKEI